MVLIIHICLQQDSIPTAYPYKPLLSLLLINTNFLSPTPNINYEVRSLHPRSRSMRPRRASCSCSG